VTVTIYHNPACTTSRKVLAMIRERGIEPRIVEYLKTPPTRDEMMELVRRMGVPLRSILRRRNTPFEALGLGDPALSDAALLDAIAEHPVLIERPIVATPRGVRLCRPPGSVAELLPPG
jgi:arsenate reductase